VSLICITLLLFFKASTMIASVERQMYYNNNTAQHSLLRDKIIENK